LKFVKFAYERKNMLLHIFRLEAKASPKRPANKRSGRKSRGACPRRVEDIIGRAPARDETGKQAGYAADGTLADRGFAGLGKYIRGTRGRRSGVVLGEIGFVLGETGRRDPPLAGARRGLGGEKGFLAGFSGKRGSARFSPGGQFDNDRDLLGDRP
jgi:hypothetical protein